MRTNDLSDFVYIRGPRSSSLFRVPISHEKINSSIKLFIVHFVYKKIFFLRFFFNYFSWMEIKKNFRSEYNLFLSTKLADQFLRIYVISARSQTLDRFAIDELLDYK